MNGRARNTVAHCNVTEFIHRNASHEAVSAVGGRLVPLFLLNTWNARFTHSTNWVRPAAPLGSGGMMPSIAMPSKLRTIRAFCLPAVVLWRTGSGSLVVKEMFGSISGCSPIACVGFGGKLRRGGEI